MKLIRFLFYWIFLFKLETQFASHTHRLRWIPRLHHPQNPVDFDRIANRNTCVWRHLFQYPTYSPSDKALLPVSVACRRITHFRQRLTQTSFNRAPSFIYRRWKATANCFRNPSLWMVIDISNLKEFLSRYLQPISIIDIKCQF